MSAVLKFKPRYTGFETRQYVLRHELALRAKLSRLLSDLGERIAQEVEREMAAEKVSLAPLLKAEWNEADHPRGDDYEAERLPSAIRPPAEVQKTTFAKARKTPPLPAWLRRVLAKVNLDGFAVEVSDAVEPEERAAYKSAGMFAHTVLSTQGAPVSRFDVIDERSVEFASKRAAWLVGKRVLPDGSYIDNPNAEYRITDMIRENLRDIIARSTEEGWSAQQTAKEIRNAEAFSDKRAKNIARTELAFAHEQGALDEWRESGVVVGKRSILADTHPAPDVCDEAADEGVIPLDALFESSGVQAPPHHPSCLCAMVPEVEIPVRKTRLSLLRKAEWNEEDHPRAPAGTSEGGQFTASETSIGIARLKEVPEAEEGYRTFDVPDSQIKLLDLGFAPGNKLFGGLPGYEDKKWVEMLVPLAGVGRGQSSVIRAAVERKLNNEENNDPVSAILSDGKFYIQAGHHRTVAAVLAGRSHIMARVIEHVTGRRFRKPKMPSNNAVAEVPVKKVRLSLLRKADWDESKHPRDEAGRFVESVAGGLGMVNDVDSQIAYHHTSESAASKIEAEGFNDSGNSMYGKGVYLTDKEIGYNQYGNTRLGIELVPHRQLSVADDTDVPRVLRQLTGVDPMFGDVSTKLRERGIKSLTTTVDGERYTVVFDKSIIKIKDRTKK